MAMEKKLFLKRGSRTQWSARKKWLTGLVIGLLALAGAAAWLLYGDRDRSSRRPASNGQRIVREIPKDQLGPGEEPPAAVETPPEEPAAEEPPSSALPPGGEEAPASAPPTEPAGESEERPLDAQGTEEPPGPAESPVAEPAPPEDSADTGEEPSEPPRPLEGESTEASGPSPGEPRAPEAPEEEQPSESSAPAEPPREAPAPPPRAEEPAPKPEPPPPKPSRPSGPRYIVRLGSFKVKENADNLLAKLKSKGYSAELGVYNHKDLGRLHIVQLKPVKSAAEARRLVNRVKSQENIDAFIVKD